MLAGRRGVSLPSPEIAGPAGGGAQHRCGASEGATSRDDINDFFKDGQRISTPKPTPPLIYVHFFYAGYWNTDVLHVVFAGNGFGVAKSRLETFLNILPLVQLVLTLPAHACRS